MKKSISKRCNCPGKPEACPHPWWCRVYARHQRQRVNLTEVYGVRPDTKRADVLEWAARAKREASEGLLTGGKPVRADGTLGSVADKFALTRKRKPYYLTGLVSLLGADTLMDDITTRDVRRAAEAWRKRPRSGPSAERHLLQVARHLFNWAVREGLATKTPFKSGQGTSLIAIAQVEGAQATPAARRGRPDSRGR